MRNQESKAPSGRPNRTPVGLRQRLSVQNKDPNFEYRIVNDHPGRVALFQEGGYEVANAQDHKVAAPRVETGTSVENTFSVGGGTSAVLMRIPKEYYTEDQKQKEEQIKSLEAALKTPAIEGAYGKISIG